MSCTHGLTVRAVREMEPGVLYQPGGGCGCHDSGRNQASVAVMVRSPVSVPAHTPSVRFQRMPFGLRVKMCVWLGVSRGLDLAFLNAD